MSTTVVKLLKEAIKVAPELAMRYAPEILDAGSQGVDFLKGIIEIGGLNSKIKKVELKKIVSMQKIGKTIYTQKIKTNNTIINDELDRLKDCDDEINEYNEKIAKIEARIKKNKPTDKTQKLFNDVDTDLRKRIEKRSKAAKKVAKTRKSKKNNK